MKDYRQCTRCVLDTTDPDITFDALGVCSHCHYFDAHYEKVLRSGDAGAQALDQIWKKIKKAGRGRDYDCILGLSGGLDSSYLLYISARAGLRILAVHVDAGWNSEAAVHNIQSLCSKLGIDLVTSVVDWSAMRQVQRAFLRSRVINQDIPQDHAFFASLYKYAVKHRIRYVLNGSNLASESIMPRAWIGYWAMDAVHIKDVFRKNSDGARFPNFPLLPLMKHVFYYPSLKRMKVVAPLNYIDYNLADARQQLKEEFGYRYPGEKHYESRFTRFHQRFNLYEHFGVDERKAHYASLILCGQMEREEALERLKKPPYHDDAERQRDIDYVCKKLSFTPEEFNEIMSRPNGRHTDYKSSQVRFFKILPVLIKIKRAILPLKR